MTDGAPQSDPGFGPVRHVFLNTDLANPTSNGIYQRIGFCRGLDLTHLDLDANT